MELGYGDGSAPVTYSPAKTQIGKSFRIKYAPTCAPRLIWYAEGASTAVLAREPGSADPLSDPGSCLSKDLTRLGVVQPTHRGVDVRQYPQFSTRVFAV